MTAAFSIPRIESPLSFLLIQKVEKEGYGELAFISPPD
jgi:hypothetical protein